MADTTLAERYKKLEEKHNKLVAELKSKVECPVCLTIPTKGPMASCPKGHLVCIPCQQSMLTNGQLACPNCREPMGNNRSLLAKTVIENIEHLCEWEECNETHPLAQLPAHMRKCCYRFRIFIQFLAFSRTNHSGNRIIVF